MYYNNTQSNMIIAMYVYSCSLVEGRLARLGGRFAAVVVILMSY